MKSLFKIAKYIIPYKVFALLSVFSNILSVLFHLLSLLAFIPFLQLLVGETEVIESIPEFSLSVDYFKERVNYEMNAYIIENGDVGALYFICLFVGVLFFAKNLFSNITNDTTAHKC